ncbi:cytochrome P450 [Phialemonium atrogriseum]|uniref:Cytochrome P450 n=1 Tax=Phialemonium atrogriseum TaxID=1093897 RepID=A0AAJ0BP79_9PEZI|nr:cytochrome P450 [Phialemonium atrogriseum]KAK1761650.1 cytochrome P450 [Phialemonium atrogriseum]
MFSERILELGSLASLREAFGETSPWTAVATFLAIAVFAVAVDYARMLRLRSKMPPGPFPLPIVGNTFMLPECKPWLWFEELSHKYQNPLITVWIGRNPTIWLNDAWTASEILDKRAGIYSSRPRMVVFAELGAGQSNMVNMYTTTPEERERWRIHRKLMHHAVGTQSIRRYRDFQNDESKLVAHELLSSPADYVKHFERYATSVVSIIGFGRRVESFNDPIITEVIAVMHLAADLNVPGKSFPMLMETLPWLAKVPNALAPWKYGLGRKRGTAFFYALADEVAKRVGHEDSFAKYLFSKREESRLSPDEIAALSGNLFGAGSDTSSSTLITFVLACCAFPETLKPAWEELDRVVGQHRSPHFDDEPNLPYVKAFVKEVLRWRPVAIMGGQPHAPTQDDYYKGYFIPKGTWIQGNLWAIHRNEREFPDPDRFNPNRFIAGHEDHRPFPGERGYMTFGWGRRVCTGQALAEQGTWISVARLLWGFNISKKQRPDGSFVDVDIFNYTNGLNMRPRPFECSFTPRSEEIRATIEREGRLALQDLEEYRGETKYRMSTFYQESTRALELYGDKKSS